MKILVVLFAILLFGANVYAQTGKIKVTVTGIVVKSKGVVKIGIYKKDGFPLVDKSITGKDVEVTNSKVTATFDEIPAGNYAIAVFQDENSDNKLNTNFFGAPSEPYGFSMNKYGTFGPPDFEDVSFKVKKDETKSLTINLE